MNKYLNCAIVCLAFFIFELNAKYVVVPNWPTIPSTISPFGAVSAVAVHHNNYVFVAQRGSVAPPIVIFSRDGIFKGGLGQGIIGTPHGLRIDPFGNVWVTDVLNQQIYEFSINGTLLRSLGVKGQAGNTSTTFNQPTDLAFDLNRNALYIADGDNGVNNRLMRFDFKTLKLVWIVQGGPSLFEQPHSLLVDRLGRIWLADRIGNRTITYDSHGAKIGTWNCWNATPNGIILDHLHHHFIVASMNDSIYRLKSPELRREKEIGNCLVEETFGGNGTAWGQFRTPHEMAVDLNGDLYIAEIINERVQKFEWQE